MTDQTAPAPRSSATNPGLVLLLCSGATFMAFLDLSVVNIAFPKILSSFPETPIATLTWVISGYAVMFAALLTPAGRLADVLGRKGVFLWALVFFTAASLVCVWAPSVNWLIVGRIGQGAGAAAMIPAGLGLILAATPRESMAKAIGAWSAAAGFSAVVGPVVGGLLVNRFDWQSIFVINGPIGLVLVIAGLRWLPRHEASRGSRLPDLLGTVSLTLGIGSLVAGLTEGGTWGWRDGRTLVLLAGGAILIAIALLRSRVHAAPAIDTKLWSSRRFAVSNVVSIFLGMSMFGFILGGALFATAVWHYSILNAAGALTIGAGASMVASVIAGRVSTASGQRVLVVVGGLVFACGTGLMGSDLANSTPAFWSVWVPAGLLGGGGLGLAVTALSATAATALPPTRFAAGVGMNVTARQVGGALGTAGLAAIFSAYNALSVAAFHDVYLACSVASILAAVVALGLSDRAKAPSRVTVTADILMDEEVEVTQ